jgi:glycosyltransferase involved in cell wall biosynthesis
MAMAKPVVVSRTSGLQDYMVPGETVSTVSCGNVAELRDAILSLWDNTHRRRELGANARSAVLANMNMDLYVRNVSQILQTCSSTAG